MKFYYLKFNLYAEIINDFVWFVDPRQTAALFVEKSSFVVSTKICKYYLKWLIMQNFDVGFY